MYQFGDARRAQESCGLQRIIKKSNSLKCGAKRSGGNDLSTAEQLLENLVSSNPLPLKGI